MSPTQPLPALPLRHHTLLGVCEGIGEDFGFNPLFLRIPLAAVVLYSPLVALGLYLALGLVVLASRLIFPVPAAVIAEGQAHHATVADNAEELKLAA